MIDPSEDCDDTLPGTGTCQTEVGTWIVDGDLTCSPTSCTYVTDACSTAGYFGMAIFGTSTFH